MLKKIRKTVLYIFILLFFLAPYSNAASLTEDDLGRIVYIHKSFKEYSGGTFFIFMGYNEQEKMCFLPFSGPQKRCILSAQRFEITNYYKDSQPYEIALDAYDLFAADSFRDLKLFDQCSELLRVMGKTELLDPLQQTKSFRLQFQKALISLHTEFNVKKSRGFDRGDLQDLLRDTFDKIKKDILLEIDNIIDQQLTKRNILTAASIYMHMKQYIKKNKLRMTFFYQGRDLFIDCKKDLAEMVEKQGTLVLNKLKERYANQAYKDKFLRKYPNARGLWNESAPSSLEGLDVFITRFYKIRRESLHYSPVSELEQWGNCRLSLLLCTSGIPEAKYLEDEFLKEFHPKKKK